jgi:carbamoyl-phosphate synthase small subunit
MKAYLVLENGRVFEGEAFGAELTPSVCLTLGEVVFTTSMTGYLETLTDPSYAGQIVLQTFPLIGNYGVNLADAESGKAYVRGYIVKTPCDEPSNFRSEGGLSDYLKSQGVVAISGVDTREITRLLRERGVMNGAITLDPATVDTDALKAYEVKDALTQVRDNEREVFAPTANVKPNGKRVALWDFGLKNAQIHNLQKRGYEVVRVPSNVTCAGLLAEKPDAVLLSNGPGDPRENIALIDEISKLTKSGVPVMGICLGHQLLALSQGAEVVKLKYGHRGANHPVRDLLSGRAYITSQNHGYAVSADKLPGGVSLRYVNINDNTCEGLDYADFPGFSAQFHPEACGGPQDTEFLFDRLGEMIK